MKNGPNRLLDSRLEKAETPCLLVDSEAMERSIASIADFASSHGVDFRPHCKTHKSPEIARKELKAGGCGIAVAKLGEAEVFANAGIKNIQIPNQIVSPEKFPRLLKVIKKARVAVGIDDKSNALALSQYMERKGASLNCLIDIDIGYGRTGIHYSRESAIARMAKLIDKSPGLAFEGIFCHAGQSYGAKSKAEIKKIGLLEGREMVKLAKAIRKSGTACPTVSVGSTPTAKYSGAVSGVTEIRAGNFIFHDATMMALGVAEEKDCALRVLATVTSSPTRARAAIDAGSKALGPEPARGFKKMPGHGQIVGRKAIVKKLSEEHGWIANIAKGEKLAVGEKLEIIPNHACFTVNLYDKIYSYKENKYYKIEARGKMQ